MAATQYVGASYVPHGWEEWNPNTYYDGLFCVSYNYSWFIAKQNVPVGISPVNTEYWAPYSLTTGAQQELVDLVKRYDPTEQLPEGTDFNAITTPGNYILQPTDGTRYVNEPPNPINLNGQLHVEFQSFPLGNVVQEVNYPGTGGSGYMTWRRIQAGTDRHWEPWVNTVNSLALDYYNFNGPFINNVDVFDTIKNGQESKWYRFGTGCTNTPAMMNYFMVYQANGQAFAFGGIERRSTVATAYWSNSESKWIGWHNIVNSSFIDNVAFNHMIKVGMKSKPTPPYEYTIYLRKNYSKRFSGILITNNSGGGGRFDLIWANNNGHLSTHELVESGVNYTISLNNSGIVITSEDPYLDVFMMSTGQSYGANAGLNNFNFQAAPYSLF